MWQCKHCKGLFNFTRLTEKANHGRHCIKNPKRKTTYAKVAKVIVCRFDIELGEYKDFPVQCFSCNSNFMVKEREKRFPSKKKYFCSRSCANRIGGKAKTEKYGMKQYATIARKFHKEECIVCYETDVLDVHHIDGDRTNNTGNNLVFLCPNDHARLHRLKDVKVIDSIKKYIGEWDC